MYDEVNSMRMMIELTDNERGKKTFGGKILSKYMCHLKKKNQTKETGNNFSL